MVDEIGYFNLSWRYLQFLKKDVEYGTEGIFLPGKGALERD